LPVLPTYPVSNPFAVNKTARSRHLASCYLLR
jgi:hypothetical protein